MTDRVKGKRRYRSPTRSGQAAQTRQRILDAAGELFAADGYGRTTVKAIAAAAGVAGDTVYATFGSKARVLTAIIDQRLVPSGDGGNVMDRPAAQTARTTAGARRQIEAFARDMAAVSERVRPVYEILRTASAVEPEMATVFAEMDGYRLTNMRRFVGWLTASGASLRVDADRAGEIVWAIASPDVARLLCDVRGWTQEDYAGWLGDTLSVALLGRPARTSTRGSGTPAP